MKIAVIAIGLPGAGKTTVLKPLAKRLGMAYVNRDEIREALLGNVHDQSRNKEVWEEANRRTEAALQRGEHVILDSTFAEGWKRRSAIELARKAGADRVIGLLFDVPIEVAKERNRARTHVVPEEAIDWMYAKLGEEPPALTDGFDSFYTHEQMDAFEEELSRVLSQSDT